MCGRNLLRCVCVCVRVGGAERAVKRSSCVLLSGDRSLKGYTLALFLTLHAPETSQRQKHVILPFFSNRLKKQLNAGCGAPCWDRRGGTCFSPEEPKTVTDREHWEAEAHLQQVLLAERSSEGWCSLAHSESFPVY